MGQEFFFSARTLMVENLLRSHFISNFLWTVYHANLQSSAIDSLSSPVASSG